MPHIYHSAFASFHPDVELTDAEDEIIKAVGGNYIYKSPIVTQFTKVYLSEKKPIMSVNGAFMSYDGLDVLASFNPELFPSIHGGMCLKTNTNIEEGN